MLDDEPIRGGTKNLFSTADTTSIGHRGWVDDYTGKDTTAGVVVAGSHGDERASLTRGELEDVVAEHRGYRGCILLHRPARSGSTTCPCGELLCGALVRTTVVAVHSTTGDTSSDVCRITANGATWIGERFSCTIHHDVIAERVDRGEGVGIVLYGELLVDDIRCVGRDACNKRPFVQVYSVEVDVSARYEVACALSVDVSRSSYCGTTRDGTRSLYLKVAIARGDVAVHGSYRCRTDGESASRRRLQAVRSDGQASTRGWVEGWCGHTDNSVDVVEVQWVAHRSPTTSREVRHVTVVEVDGAVGIKPECPVPVVGGEDDVAVVVFGLNNLCTSHVLRLSLHMNLGRVVARDVHRTVLPVRAHMWCPDVHELPAEVDDVETVPFG